MILFKITSCPDKNQVGVYQHESNDLSFGSADADMVIDDPEISPTQVAITYSKGSFFVANLKTKVGVRLNGTQLSGKPTPIKSNDSLNMGGTTIFFTQINDKPLVSPPRYVNESVQGRLLRDGSPENSILRALAFLSGEESSPPGEVTSTGAMTAGPEVSTSGSVANWTSTKIVSPPPVPKKG